MPPPRSQRKLRAPTQPLTIWHWNCRSFRKKKASLQPYTSQHHPAVIALQEVEAQHPTLRDYITFQNDSSIRTATLVHNRYTAQHHALTSTIDCILVEILPTRKSDRSIFVLNVYSPPQLTLADFPTLLKQVLSLAKQHQLVITGDFNAPHMAWGYPRNARKGTIVWDAINQHRLTLCNLPNTPTRIGNSVSRDTTPDLTFVRNVTEYTWQCLPDTFGSDHHIISTTIQGIAPSRIGTARLTDWKTLREHLPTEEINDLDRWTAALSDLLKAHSREFSLTTDYPAVDQRLNNLWTARNSLVKRWKRNKTNRKLKLRIAHLTRQAEEYAQSLSQHNWMQFCDRLQGTLGTRKTWHLIRSLMGTKETKSATDQRIHRLIHNHPGTEQELIDTLQKKFARDPSQPSPQYPVYAGSHNAALDAPFTMQELEAELSKLIRNTTPGHDHISNKLLRNLDDLAFENLLQFINSHWARGTLPPQWRHADITLIPKPNKSVSLSNLRPISLTSCVGKLMEHLVHTRLTDYIEDNALLPNTMYGFRPHLSTQDILLQLKEDIILRIPKNHKYCILALDIKGAFDNVTHDAILHGLATLNPGSNTYNYVKAFLTERTATVGLGHLRSPKFTAIPRGTPQGSVISPLLFNIAIKDLSAQLSTIPDLRHALYADDLTLWTTTGSIGDQQEALQTAVDCTCRYLEERGLTCAPEKSALLTLQQRTRTEESLQYQTLNSIFKTFLFQL